MMYDYDRRAAASLTVTEAAVLGRALARGGSVEIILDRGGAGVRAHRAAVSLAKKGLLTFIESQEGIQHTEWRSVHWTSSLYRLTPEGKTLAEQLPKRA